MRSAEAVEVHNFIAAWASRIECRLERLRSAVAHVAQLRNAPVTRSLCVNSAASSLAGWGVAGFGRCSAICTAPAGGELHDPGETIAGASEWSWSSGSARTGFGCTARRDARLVTCPGQPYRVSGHDVRISGTAPLCQVIEGWLPSLRLYRGECVFLCPSKPQVIAPSLTC